MKNKLFKPVMLLMLGVFILALVPARPADASWHAQRLLELRNQQNSAATPAPGTPRNPVNSNTPAQPQPQPNPPAPTQGYSNEQNQLVELINQERIAQGLKPLSVHPGLMELAQKKSQEMKDKNYFSHTSPTSGSFFSMVANAGIKYKSVGENLAQARNVKTAHILLMASQPHKENILRAGFTHVGVGVVSTQYGVIVTELFITQ